MNILISDNWLRQYLNTNASPKQIQECLSLCGPSIERLHQDANDYIYDVEVTTNRVDCMGVLGIAREAAAILPQFGYDASLKIPKLHRFINGDIPGLSVFNDSHLCHRILALKVENVSVGSSPEWLQSKLTAVGQRPLNNLVDITNYVMWETAHPAHVFDLDRLNTGKMVIREAIDCETITSLDGNNYTMKGGEVVIDDGTGKIIDLPSIIGTANSAVVSSTKTGLFFIDDVEANRVRYASMTHAIRTQAATLMEKGVDPELGILAMSRIYDLVRQLFPSAKFSLLLDIYPRPAIPQPITLPIEKISSSIGVNLTTQAIKTTLTNLGMSVKPSSKHITVLPPTWRTSDIKIPEDIIEEVARIYGYHNIPSVLMSSKLPVEPPDPIFIWESKIKTALKYLNFTEIYTYSLVDHEENSLKIANPLSTEWQYLRKSLFPSHKNVIADNIGRIPELNLFEISNVYLPQPTSLPLEESHLILTTTNPDYYIFKGKIESLLSDLNISEFTLNIQNTSGILYWETNVFQLIRQAKSNKTYTPISPFPPIIEDFNIQSKMSYANLVAHITSLSPLVTQIDLIDNYQGKLTLRISFHSPDRQLSSDDISDIRKKILGIK